MLNPSNKTVMWINIKRSYNVLLLHLIMLMLGPYHYINRHGHRIKGILHHAIILANTKPDNILLMFLVPNNRSDDLREW